MTSLFVVVLLSIVAAAVALRYFLNLRMMRAAESRPVSSNVAGRYRPMLRLLAEDDLASLATDAVSLKTLRAERRRIFRGYLSCLKKDYAGLLAAVRNVMVQSGVDRPDLARALAKNRSLFALAVCKLEFRLALHWAGIGTVDVSGLVEAFDMLRQQVASFNVAPSVRTA